MKIKACFLHRNCRGNLRIATKISVLILLVVSIQACTKYLAIGSCSNQIAFVLESADGKESDIYLVNSDGSELRKITNSPSYETTPSWSPDGNKIAFYFGSGNKAEIHVIDIDGFSKKNITNGIGADSYPIWSPDGKQIAFSNSDSGTHIYIMLLDGLKRIQVTRQLVNNSESRSFFPVWRPVFCK